MAETFKRVVDLARLAGVSTQQVRNLEAAGVLPEVERTATGYRRYASEHLGALLAYQALAAGHGAATARTIVREINQGELPAALSRLDASHAELHDQRRTLEQLHQTLDALAAAPVEDAPIPAAGMRVGELARHLGVRPSALRVWESAGLLAPTREKATTYRRYAPADIRDARIIHLLRQGNYSFDRIRPVLAGLRGTGGTAAVHTALDERRAALHGRAVAMLRGAARLHEYQELISGSRTADA